MNSREKELLQVSIDSEKEVLEKVKDVYKKALDDINSKIAELIGREATADENTLQSIIYQKQYQQALKQQISGILDTMNGEQFTAISDYLTKSYEEGFYGTMYDLHGQGIPLIFPINQEQVVAAVQTDSKISEGLYKKLGEDTNLLKKRISNNISRGIAQGSSYTDIARNIAGGMIGYNPNNPGGAFARAMRITRTESHRIVQQSANHARYKAKDKGADIIVQWDATLDARTRDSHAKVDGELRELGKPFSNGLLYPGDPNGPAAEVVNCRCVGLQRAKWALDEEELEILKERAAYFGLDKADNFEEFKQKYIKAVDKVSVEEYNKINEKNKNKITLITDDAIKKVPKVKIDGYTDSECEYIQKQHKELLRYARDNNESKEVAFVFEKGLKNRLEFKGSESGLDFGTSLSGKGKDLFVMHNHPRNSSFSKTDVDELINNDNISFLSVVKNNGNVEILYKGNDYDKKTAVLLKERCVRKYIQNKSEQEYKKMMNVLLNNAVKKGLLIWIK